MEATMQTSSSNGKGNGSNKRLHGAAFDTKDAAYEVGELVEPTPTNIMGIPNMPPYRIILVANQTFNDVVATGDLDYIRKLTQIAWRYYTDPRTACMWVTYDPNDCAYEISWSFPADMEVSHDIHNALYKLSPMFVTKHSWTVPWCDEKSELWTVFSIRVASYRRKYLTIKNTHLMMWETEETIMIPNEEAKSIPPNKRARTDAGK